MNVFSVLVARTFADAVRLAVQLVVAMIAGIVFLEFRPASVLGVIAALAVTVLVGWGLGWVFVALATWNRKAETMQAISFIVMFPLMFGSSAYMPIDAMPKWMQIISKINPLTYAIDATRALTLDKPAGKAVLISIGLAIATAILGGLASAYNFRKASR
jgi:ABC-2 type transport system permease protein